MQCCETLLGRVCCIGLSILCVSTLKGPYSEWAYWGVVEAGVLTALAALALAGFRKYCSEV